MMIERIALCWSNWLVKYSEENHDISKVAHALSSLISNVLITLISLSIGLFLNNFKDTLIALLLMATVRKLTNGRHFPSMESCIIFSSIVAVVIPFTPSLPNGVRLSVASIFLLCVVIHFKSVYGEGQFNRYRWTYTTFFGIILLIFVFNSDIITSVLLIQIFFLAPLEGGKGVKSMLKKIATYLSKTLEKGKDPLEKWMWGEPSIKVSDQRSSNENTSIKADRKKRI